MMITQVVGGAQIDLELHAADPEPRRLACRPPPRSSSSTTVAWIFLIAA